MAKKSIKKNYILNVSYQVLTLLTPLLTTPYVSRVLGADGIGTYSFSESIVSYFMLLAVMGITTYGQREISYVQDDIVKRSILFWETKLLESFSATIVIIVYLIFAFYQNNAIIYILFSFNLFSVLADVNWFFQGMEEFSIIVKRNVLFKIMGIVYIFMFIHHKDDLILYVLGITIFNLLSNISLWIKLPKFILRPVWKELRPFKNTGIVLSLFVPTIAIQLYTVLDKTMIGIITKDPFENGYYEQALKISRMALTLVTSLGTVMIPRIGFHFARKETEKVVFFMHRSYTFVWFLGTPLCLGLAGIASNFVPWFYGEGYGKVAPLLCILSFLILPIGINNVTGMQYLIPTGRQRIFTITVIIGALVNLIMNVVLIPRFQSLGAAIASVMAETIIAIVQLYMVRKELSLTVVIKKSAHYIAAGVVMLAVLTLESLFFRESFLNTILMIFSGGIMYFLALIILKDEFFLSNINIMLDKIKKSK